MTKAENAALDAYPDYTAQNGERISNSGYRRIYVEGYQQAEKDLALTWQDMWLIDYIIKKVENEIYDLEIESDGVEEAYQEVLRRFNELKAK